MSAVDIFLMITSLLGGLAMFLFGMSLMSDTLTEIAGNSFKSVIEKATKGRVRGYTFGTLVTALVQSSSTTTVMVVGFVNAGILTLIQAANVILGANLGTTATAWLLSLNGVGGESLILTIIKPANFAPVLAIISVFILMFCKSEMKKKVATVIFGFSLLMMGMAFMSSAVGPLKELPAFRDLLTSFANPFLGYLVAVLFTMIIQSCDATVGIVQALAMGVGVTYGTCIPLICGAQMGTCITSILSSIGGSKNGKRAAFIQLFYNIFKTVMFLAVFYLLNSWFHFSFLESEASLVGIAFVHSMINIIFSIIVLPASGLLVKLVTKVLPMTDKERDMDAILSLLDTSFYKTPSFAVEQAKKVIDRVADMIVTGNEAIRTANSETLAKSQEKVININEDVSVYCDKVKEYISQINEAALNEESEAKLAITRDACINFESIVHTVSNMKKQHEAISGQDLKITEESRKGMRMLLDAMGEILEISVTGFKACNPAFVRSSPMFREVIFDLGERLQKDAIRQLHEGVYDYPEQMLLNFNINSIDRIVSCCDNIGNSVESNMSKVHGKKKSAIDEDRQMEIITELFRDKYMVFEKEQQ